jgi:hypothetical protein
VPLLGIENGTVDPNLVLLDRRLRRGTGEVT